MQIKWLNIIMLIFVLPAITLAQLSPGPLADAHAELEGVRNCTLCHDLGKKVSNIKCLDCHSEIKSRLDQNKGYHSSREVKGKDCFECHSDHHGRKFEMIRFDEDNFNHNLAGYELTGAHKVIDCRECHVSDNIDDPELRQKSNTFLGLDKECLSCHDDYHQETLSNNCASCHTTDAFAPAEKFNHDNADFSLVGKHEAVDCIDCHQKETRSGKAFQKFTGLEFNNCNSCHEDAHRNNLGKDCKACHTEQSFNTFAGKRKFNHSRTKFPLKGKHQHVDCAQCHDMDASPTKIFQEGKGVSTSDCAQCHEDVHDNKFGPNCAECHNEQSFRTTNTGALDEFNHSITGFDLVGRHEFVDCSDCHTGSLIDPLPHNECASCHSDYHESQLADNGKAPDCADCHTEDGFENTLFGIEDHETTKFPLDGAHLATPCFLCHVQEDKEKWQFRNIGERCADCHEDVHAGYIDQKYYPDQACTNCHITESWQENTFDHKLTDFPLLGAHNVQQCMACHGNNDESQVSGDLSHKNRYGNFANLSVECASCHEDSHNRQFEIEGKTSCAECHGNDNWRIPDFDHDKTAFKLDGKHVEVECAGCHKPIEEEGKSFVQYKFESFECVVCH